MSETMAPAKKPQVAKPLGDQYGTLSEKLTFWARFAAHSPAREAMNAAARELQKSESKQAKKSG